MAARVLFGQSPFRDVISTSNNDLVIFASDVLGQPHRALYAETNPYVYAKCSRALPVAKNEDLVLLSGKLDQQYYQWIRSLGMGPAETVAFGYEGVDKSLSELVIENPAEVLKTIEKTGRKPIYVPFYSGHTEAECAKTLGAELFGAEEGVCAKYFSKATFKEECIKLGINVVGGVEHKLTDHDPIEYEELEKLVHALLGDYGSVIIRGEHGSAGSSIYQTNSPDIVEIYNDIKKNNEKRLLVEPMLKVIASPNDQWAIDKNGDIHHLGLSAQLFEGLKHAGNLKGQYFSSRAYKQMTTISKIIVKQMASDGYKGVCGVDYIICDSGIFPIENNARVNGSTYTYAIINNIEKRIGKVPCWKFFKAKTNKCDFDSLKEQIESLLYDGSRINSVFPYDCDTLSINGTFAAVLLAEDMYHIEYLEEALRYLDVNRI
ncbi:MAG: hypothetical protein H6619_03210 [Deltaproteobacteria bacterium]|nr:hypothetical protein [Deltaproteobacteria bacterium]